MQMQLWVVYLEIVQSLFISGGLIVLTYLLIKDIIRMNKKHKEYLKWCKENNEYRARKRIH